MDPTEEPARMPAVWGLSAILRVAVPVVGWVVVWAATAAAMYAVAYAVSPFGPSCVTNRPGVPPHLTVPLWMVNSVAVATATLLVGLYWALGVQGRSRRVLVVIFVVGLAGILGYTLGVALTPGCT